MVGQTCLMWGDWRVRPNRQRDSITVPQSTVAPAVLVTQQEFPLKEEVYLPEQLRQSTETRQIVDVGTVTRGGALGSEMGQTP